MNQINLFHKWLDRHRNMCEKWSNNKEEILDKLKEKWDKDNNSGNINPSGNDIPSSNKTLSSDVSIQIDMDNPKTINMVDTNPNNSTMDNILDDLDHKFHEPNCYDIYEDDIYYDVNDEHNTSTVNPNDMEKPTKVQIELTVKNNKLVKENFPLGDVWDI
ncbi:erythrocyte membrane protein 1, PfEMP1, putative [Plasmodium sp. DRC-Itaito]|nr:erythrocyte membrane protein 1, PfEMP1, putative [Plasmodium sp. DRC-Itaito]